MMMNNNNIKLKRVHKVAILRPTSGVDSMNRLEYVKLVNYFYIDSETTILKWNPTRK